MLTKPLLPRSPQKNFLGSKMKKRITTLYNGGGPTSTLNQHNPEIAHSSVGQPTLEEMILQLELEEEHARRERLQYDHRDRLSCVNSSNILHHARSALNQYPRFSLDGRDAMYRPSFRTCDATAARTSGRKSICCDHSLRERYYQREFESKVGKASCLPQTLAGKSVIWCKPGVVAKLMGLEAMPMPIRSPKSREKLSSMMKGKNLRQRAEQHEMERRVTLKMRNCDAFRGGRIRSCSRLGHCVMKPVTVEPAQSESERQAPNFLQVP